MSQRVNGRDGTAEMELQITWHQWHDGRWEAWVTDASGRPPHLVRDRAELEQFLSQAYGSGNHHCEVTSNSNPS